MTDPAVNVAIIGSGPASLAAAWQLISRGVVPTILDCGDTLPQDAAQDVDALRNEFPLISNETRLKVTKARNTVDQQAYQKLVFGSDYLYGHGRRHSPIINSSLINPTFAKGGYTVGWGGAVLPIHSLDMTSWPFPRTALDEGFKEIASRFAFYGTKDELNDEFPLATSNDEQSLKASEQVLDVLARLGKLHERHVFLSGRSRLAINASDCRYCGLCLTACPFGVIKTVDQIFDRLRQQKLVRYLSNIVVTRLAESDGRVQVYTVDGQGKARPMLQFTRVFLAAGAINSARIAMESFQRFETDIKILDSQKFAVPILVPERDTSEPSQRNVLPSIFVDARLPSFSDKWAHLQISSLSEYALSVIERRLRFGRMPLDQFIAPLTGRLMIGWGGLHSDYSNSLKIRLLRAHRFERPILKIQPDITGNGVLNAKLAIKEFSKIMRLQKLRMLSLGSILGSPGAGFHFGGSLPMTANRKKWNECDVDGKLQGWQRVNVIDSSTFPSIPSTTMVFTIMANAWRILSKQELSI